VGMYRRRLLKRDENEILIVSNCSFQMQIWEENKSVEKRMHKIPMTVMMDFDLVEKSACCTKGVEVLFCSWLEKIKTQMHAKMPF